MSSYFRRIISLFQKPSSKEDKSLYSAVTLITGSQPINFSLYKLAMQHSSVSNVNEQGVRESNERLEYLGDAVIGMVIADFLFAKFPFQDEGFLTEIRSKIVNRESLNTVSKKIGLKDLIQFHKNNKALSPKSIYGDSLEALIGAIYLDKGYRFSKNFIIKKLVNPHFDVNALITTITNHKSKIIEWAQKEGKSLTFETEDDGLNKKGRQFVSQIFIDDKAFEKGYGLNKKKAEQDAARNTLDHLNLINDE